MGGRLTFEVLGALRVSRDGVDLRLSGALQRTLLAVLLARRGGVVPAGVLCDAVWPGQTVGEQRLHVLVFRLRRILGDADRIALENDGYRLRVDPDELDLDRFTSAIAAADDEPDPARTAELLADAMALWRGEPFDGLDLPLLNAEAARLVEVRLEATERWFKAELRCGRHESVVGVLTEQVREHPLRERLSCLLMIALARCGRRAEALAVYRATRRTLVEELGLEPGPELRAVERQVLAGERIDVDAPPPRSMIPAQLPPAVRDFVGRQVELSELDDARGTSAVCVIAGTAGVGKTALALRWAHRVRADFPDGQLYADLRGFGPDEPLPTADVLAGFLRELGVAGNAIPHELSERVARLRTLVDGRRMLVVLDNARTADQVRPLLPGSSSVFVLVTSRNSLTGLAARDGSRRVALGRLPAGEADALIRGAVGWRADAEPDAVAALVEQCARLPLALTIVAELINLRQTMPIADMVTELASEQDRLDALDMDDDVQSSVRAVFSWSYQSLTPATARLFRLCGLFPGPEIDLYALAALAGTDLAATRRALDQLVRAHLVDQTTDRRVQLHDLLSAYAAELAERIDPADDRSAALQRLSAFYGNAVFSATEHFEPDHVTMRPVPEPTALPLPIFADGTHARRWLDAERANLTRVAAAASDHDSPRTAVVLSALLYRYLDNGYLDDALALHGRARDSARQVGDPIGEAHAVELLARTHLRRGDLESALSLGTQAYETYVDLGVRRHQAVCLVFLGWVSFAGADYQKALDCFTRASAAPGDDVLRIEFLRGIGTVHSRLGRLAEAKRCLLEALAAARTSSDSRERTVRSNLGRVCQRLGQYEEAADHLERSNQRATGTGLPTELVQIAANHELASVYWALGRRDDAFAAAWRCLAASREAGMSVAHAQVLVVLGQLHRLAGELPDAAEHYREALLLSEQTGERFSMAQAHDGLGDVLAGQGDFVAARESWRTALSLFRALGVPEASTVDDKLVARSELGAHS